MPPDRPDCPPPIPFAAEWRQPNGFGAADLAPGAPLPARLGWERLGFEHLGAGSGFFDYQGELRSPVAVHGRVVSDEPCLILRILVEGRARVALSGMDPGLETTGNYGLYLHSNGRDCTIENAPREAHSLVGPMLGRAQLRDMLDGERIAAQPVARFLEGPCDDFVALPRMSPVVRQLAGALRACPYEGAMRQLYLKAKIYELMAEVLADLSDPPGGPARLLSADRRKALAAREILMADLGQPPAIGDLARRVGLSQRRLNEAFRELYGDTVFRCLTRWRLEHAQVLLLKEELPLKEIAYRLGYSHLNNFILAFARHFGSPPATFRRSRAKGPDA